MDENISSIILIREIQCMEEKLLNQEMKVLDITIAQAKALGVLLRQVGISFLPYQRYWEIEDDY